MSVAEAVKHPQFSAEGKPYDVALIRLANALADVSPAVLSEAALTNEDVGAPIRHVGFGTTSDDWHYIKDIASGGLKREVTYPVTKVDDFFVWSGAPGQQTCLFDSGGPAFRVVDGRERIIAIVSAGDDCHTDGWDTRIDRTDILTWIDERLAAWGTHRP